MRAVEPECPMKTMRKLVALPGRRAHLGMSASRRARTLASAGGGDKSGAGGSSAGAGSDSGMGMAGYGWRMCEERRKRSERRAKKSRVVWSERRRGGALESEGRNMLSREGLEDGRSRWRWCMTGGERGALGRWVIIRSGDLLRVSGTGARVRARARVRRGEGRGGRRREEGVRGGAV